MVHVRPAFRSRQSRIAKNTRTFSLIISRQPRNLSNLQSATCPKAIPVGSILMETLGNIIRSNSCKADGFSSEGWLSIPYQFHCHPGRLTSWFDYEAFPDDVSFSFLWDSGNMARESSCGRCAFVIGHQGHASAVRGICSDFKLYIGVLVVLQVLVVLRFLALSFLSGNQNLRQLTQHVANYGGLIILSGLELRTGKS